MSNFHVKPQEHTRLETFIKPAGGPIVHMKSKHHLQIYAPCDASAIAAVGQRWFPERIFLLPGCMMRGFAGVRGSGELGRAAAAARTTDLRGAFTVERNSEILLEFGFHL
jgi:hypothetical protein